jgi:hypothetical protein
MMKLKKLMPIFVMFASLNVYAADEWTYIGNTANGARVFATTADRMPDGSLRMFLKSEQDYEKQPEGLFAFLKKPEKYTETTDPFSVLIQCKNKTGRNYKAGTFGTEFYIPWEPITPGSYGSVAYNAFCKKAK